MSELIIIGLKALTFTLVVLQLILVPFSCNLRVAVLFLLLGTIRQFLCSLACDLERVFSDN